MKFYLRIFRKSIEQSQVLLQEYLVSGTGNEAPRYVVFSSPPPYLVPLKSDYLSQHYILEKPYPVLFPKCEKPSFTLTENNKQNNISLCNHAPLNDAAVNDGPHIRRWSHKITVL